MKKSLPILIMAVVCCFLGAAQPAALNCGNGRYVNNVFSAVTKDTGIIYGFNTVPVYLSSTPPPANPVPVTLKLDFYQPQGDAATKRPLIILAFGGSFIAGQRSDLDTVCKVLAQKGYTVATIDYRIIYPDPYNIITVYSTPALLADAVVKACADMKASIRFFKRNAATINTYRIDTTKIFVGGYSAGAITALQTAYTDDIFENPTTTNAYLANGGIEGNTDLPGSPLLPTYNARGIAGVISIAGGVSDTNLIDANNPPLYMAHGTRDSTVFYNYGAAGGSTFLLYGGGAMRTRANNIGLLNQLYTIQNGNHQSPVALDSVYLGQILNSGAAFLQPIVCNGALPVSLTSFTAENANCEVVLRWQTATEKGSGRYEVELSTDGSKFMKVGVVPSKNNSTGADYAYTYKGFTGTAYFRLKMVDADGYYTYSPIQKLTQSCGSSLVQVYPNPAQEQTLVTGLKSGMQVQLLNAQGQKLWLQKATGSAMQLPLTAFTSGLYMVQVADADGKIISTTKLMKQ